MRTLTKEYIESLAEKKLLGTITQREQTLLDQWLGREPGKEMVWLSKETDEQELRDKLLQRITEDAGIDSHSSTVRSMSILRRYRWAAAVALLLAGGYLSYFFFFSQNTSSDKLADNAALIQNIAPGHAGAVLTLANGKKIVLDSAGNGTIADQGNRRLVKKNGQLVYEDVLASSSKGQADAADILYNTITTARGREFQVTLSDGTKVWLNAGSSITYPTAFLGKERRVTVTGEAYFEVAPDKKLPFIVNAPDGVEVEVLGTAFNIQAYSDEANQRTTLIRGAVKIISNNQQVILKPGEAADVKENIQVLKNVDTARAIAWKEGYFDFDNTSLEEVMRQLSRWYNIDVTSQGKFPPIMFGGEIPRNIPLAGVLKTLTDAGVRYKMVDQEHILILP